MKILLAFIFICFEFVINAQLITPLPKDGQWCFSDNKTHPDDPVSTYYEYIYSIENDTIIHGITYKNVATTKTLFKSCCYEGEMIYNDEAEFLGYAGALRYEGEKAFFYKYDYDALGYGYAMPNNCLELPDTTEVLIYDFSLEEGDVFNYDPSTWFDPITVYLADSILMNDGKNHKRLQFADDFDAGEWVEGVGDLTEGLLGPYVFFGEGCDWTLLCVHENAGPLYSELYCEYPCHVNESTSINIQNENNTIQIIPNPAVNNFYLGNENGNPINLDEAITIIIRDLNGEFIYRYTKKLSEAIDIEDIFPGVYIIEVVEGENSYYKKLIKM